MLENEFQSCVTRHSLKCSLDISYGDSSGQKLDIFPASYSNAPVLIFIHGGYFKALDKRQYSYIAKPFVDAGCTVALINYNLAPQVSVTEIVEQNIKAFQWIDENIHRWNGNVRDIVLCGHSVGAFLVAKILEHNWDNKIRESISGTALLSGLFDLGPMQKSYLNESLNLSNDDITQLSPIHQQAKDFPKTLIAVGDDETDEFIKQSKDYSDKLQAHEFMLLKNKNHYTVSRLLGRRENLLMDKIFDLFKSKL